MLNGRYVAFEKVLIVVVYKVLHCQYDVIIRSNMSTRKSLLWARSGSKGHVESLQSLLQ